MIRIAKTILLAGVVFTGQIAAPTVNVYLIGDSTMADKPTPDVNPERGWGQLLPKFFDAHVALHNHAVNGRSTKSFIDEGRWNAVVAQLGAGDYVLIEFGHNDEKADDSTRYAAPHGAYRANLVRFVNEARAKHAVPVLLTPIVRRKFDARDVLQDTHGEYPAVVREVATELRVPLIDLLASTSDLVRAAGPDNSKRLYVWVAPGASTMYPEGRQDDTHLSVAGATSVAKLVAHALKSLDPRLGAFVIGAERATPARKSASLTAVSRSG
ncbi:MAG TPA: rhamnogalacturonan acetylesterase [Gemmatimonadaceae bacterium]|nr:rhamnogalacturonan acetylesterase [Gemmatimonadaceae bacterium]